MYSYRDITGDKHLLVNSGPYRYIRHPLYMSYLLFLLGLLFINVSVLTVLMVAGLGVYFWYWIRAEEKSLLARVDGYRDYMLETPRFIPRLWGVERSKRDRSD
jgi:protein-S-isoprenylcysteine O-methyltransferase Ste14